MNPTTIHALEIAAVVVAGTMTGNEIAVAVFFYPRISRLEDTVHVRAAQTLASVLGTVMPFWYALTFLLSPAATFAGHTNWSTPWWLSLASTAYQQPDCGLEGGVPTSQLARVASALGHASCH